MKPQNTIANELSKNLPHLKVSTIYRRVELAKWVKPVVKEVKR